MPLKGVIQKDVIAGNKYQLLVGTTELLVTSIGGFEEVLVTTDLPDGTRASAGRTEPFEFDISIPYHHTEDVDFMNLWFRGAQDPVRPDCYRTISMISQSGTGEIVRTATIFGAFPTTRSNPERALDNSDMTVITFTISGDSSIPS